MRGFSSSYDAELLLKKSNSCLISAAWCYAAALALNVPNQMIVRPRLLLAWASLTQPRSRSTQMHTLRSPHQPSQIDSACRQLSLTYPQGLPLVTRRRRGHTGESLKARATPSAKVMSTTSTTVKGMQHVLRVSGYSLQTTRPPNWCCYCCLAGTWARRTSRWHRSGNH